jgi:hypothetical protein
MRSFAVAAACAAFTIVGFAGSASAQTADTTTTTIQHVRVLADNRITFRVKDSTAAGKCSSGWFVAPAAAANHMLTLLTSALLSGRPVYITYTWVTGATGMCTVGEVTLK